MSTTVRPKRERPEADWDLVFKRNPVERIKRDKAPLGIRDELPALIAAGYEAVAEEDIVRLQWWGLYHDKPKIGTFMLRVKLPAGFVEPARLRAIGEVSNRYGRGVGELATRQNVQLHRLALDSLPDVFAHLDAAGITTAGGCGDTVRNITGSPVQGIDPLELFDCTDVIQEAADFFYGNPDFSNLPRKHKYSIAATPTATTRPRSTASRSWARCTRARRGSACSSAADSRPCRASRGTGRVRPQGRGRRGARGDHGGVGGRPQLPRQPRQGAAQVHDRRHRPGGHARARRGSPRPHARRLRAAGAGARLARSPGRQRAEAARAQLHRRARAPRADLGRSDDRRRRHRRARRGRRPHHPAAELPDRQRAGRERARRRRRAGGHRLLARGQPRARPLGRLHRRAALQLLGDRDEAAPGPADRVPRGALRRCDQSARPAARRLPARVRAALDRRSRLPGHDGARRRRQARAGVRHLRPRRPRAGRADRQGRCSAASRARSSTRRSQDSSRAGSTAATRRTSRSPRSRAGRATRSWASPPGSSPSRDAYARRRNEHGAVR